MNKLLLKNFPGLFLIIFTLLSGSVYAQQQVVGAIDGVFDVSDLGGASYTIPIKLPAGINGVQPSLSLNYTSQGGNGIMGMGWNLSGLSAITRIGQNIYDDNATKGIALNADDRFALDGQRLVLTSGSTYGASGTQYATETETYRIIKATGVSGNGPLSFTVTDQNGWVFTYGGTTDSRLTYNTNVIAWYLSGVKDLNGNQVVYTYTNNGTESPTVAKISYNGNPGQSLAYQTQVLFNYTSRSDNNFSYVAGRKLTQTKLLSSIVIQQLSGSFTTIHQYALQYQTNQFAHLVKVREIGGNNAEEVGATILEYGSNNAAFQPIAYNALNSTVDSLLYKTKYEMLDVNGDGKSDVLEYPYSVAETEYNLFINNGNGFNTPIIGNFLPSPFSDPGMVDNAIPWSEQNERYPFDYNGDGKEDFLLLQRYTPTSNPNANQQKYWVYLSNGTGLSTPLNIVSGSDPTQSSQSIFANKMPMMGDFDGDGKIEVLLLNMKENPTTDEPAPSFIFGEKYTTTISYSGGTANKAKLLSPSSMPFDASYVNYGVSQLRVIDYNGDGRSEILSIWHDNQANVDHAQVFALNVTFDANHNPIIGTPAFVQVGDGGYPTIWHKGLYTGDFNGDGVTDILTWINQVGWEIGYGDGKGSYGQILPCPFTMLPAQDDCNDYTGSIIIADFNGDGKSDIYEDLFNANSNCNTTANTPAAIHYSYGNNTFSSAEAFPAYTGSFPGTYALDAGGAPSGYPASPIGDLNGDGAADALVWVAQDPFTNYTDNRYAFGMFFHPNENRHLVSQITNGLGAFTKVNYASIANNSTVYQAGTATSTYPVFRKTIPLKVVLSIVEDNGINATGNTTTFKYEGLKLGYWGRGILGFDKVTRTNAVTLASSERQYTLNTTYYIPLLTAVTNKVNGTTVSTQTSTYGIKDFGNKRIFPYISQSSSSDNITQQNTLMSYDYGTPDPFTGFSGFTIGKPFAVTTLKGHRSYLQYVNGTWQNITNQIEKSVQSFSYPNPFIIIVGGSALPYQARFLPSKIITTITRAGDADYTRSTSFTYNYDRALLLTSVQDPGTANAVTTGYSYSNYGNMVVEAVTSSGLPTMSKYTLRDATQRYVIKRFNTLYPTLTTDYTYNVLTGDLLTQTDPDGFKTTYTYDAFGRVKTTSNNNGPSSSVQYSWNSSVPNAKYAVTTDDNTSDPAVVYYDRLGRELRNMHIGFNGDNILQNTAYNNKGQVISTSLPYFATGGTILNTTYQYDVYGRQTQVAAPTGTTTYTYTGTPNNVIVGSGLNNGKYVVKITDPSGYFKTTTTDASGAAITSEDPGGVLGYTYSSNGGVKTTTLAGQQVLNTEYDAFGRKITETDPNYGSYHYTYNAYGQLLTQEDPSGNLYHYTYNNLGGIATKSGPEGTYTYTYSLTAGTNVFKLTKLAGPEGTITYNHGKGGQLLSEKRVTGSLDFVNGYTYNTLGQLDTRTYPDGSVVQYAYNSHDGSCSNIGIPGEIINTQLLGPQPAYIYSIVNKNAFDQVTSSGFGAMSNPGIPGAGFVTPHIFDAKGYDQYGLLTGQSTYIMSTQGPLPGFRGVQYNFTPSTGNLAMRKDVIHNLQENFTYDNVKRLSAITGTPGTVPGLTMEYDANGNIHNKTDAGKFAYDQANRLSEINPYVNIPEPTQLLTYTPFNKVKTIDEHGINAMFTYWPDGERASMKITGGDHPRVIYYAPGYEKVEDDNYKREYCYLEDEQGHITAIIGKDDNTGAALRYYVLTDYLGSVTHVLNTDGSIAEEKSYDAWGRYRKPDTWSPFDPTYADMAFYRGYTGHEYIPEFGIINMNGRLYDPLMGRMFSPDPYIMGSDNTQGYNRYTYALNNPLSYTDPSGEFLLTWGINTNGSLSIGLNFGLAGFGLNIGIGDAGTSFGIYGELGPRVGGTGLGSGLTISESIDYNFKNANLSATSSANAYASFTAFTAGAGASKTYDITNNKWSDWSWSVNAGIGIGNDEGGLGLYASYGSNGWGYGLGGFYNSNAWDANPAYEPDKWNDNGTIQYNNNCYSYALDDPNNPFGGKPQPGEYSGIRDPYYPNSTLGEVLDASLKDGWVKKPNFLNRLGFGKRGYYSVYLVIDNSGQIQDYHWYRQDKGGLWSQKHGSFPVDNIDGSKHIIRNPARANQNYGSGLNYNGGGILLWKRR